VFGGNIGERVLQTVKNGAEQTRAECHRQHFAALDDLVANPDAGRAFKDLSFRRLAAHTQNFGLEILARLAVALRPVWDDVDHFILDQRRILKRRKRDQIVLDRNDLGCRFRKLDMAGHEEAPSKDGVLSERKSLSAAIGSGVCVPLSAADTSACKRVLAASSP